MAFRSCQLALSCASILLKSTSHYGNKMACEWFCVVWKSSLDLWHFMALCSCHIALTYVSLCCVRVDNSSLQCQVRSSHFGQNKILRFLNSFTNWRIKKVHHCVFACVMLTRNSLICFASNSCFNRSHKQEKHTEHPFKHGEIIVTHSGVANYICKVEVWLK